MMITVLIVAVLFAVWRRSTVITTGPTRGVWITLGPLQIAAYRQTWSNASFNVVHIGIILE